MSVYNFDLVNLNVVLQGNCCSSAEVRTQPSVILLDSVASC